MTSAGPVGRRLLQLVPILLGVSLLVFFMLHFVPGDPARAVLGIRAPQSAIDALRQEWGLDRPIVSQYMLFLGRVTRGDLGESLLYREPATALVFARLPVTLWLLVYSAVLSVVISVPLAVLAAARHGRPADQMVRAIPSIGLGMPSFWVGIMLILLFSLTWHVFPVGGYGDDVPGHLWSMFLPALTVAIAISPTLIRSLRASLLESLDAEFVTTARAAGLSERRIMRRHVLPNAAVPAITVLGLNIGFLVGGTVVVENVFALPGLGSLLLVGIQNRDFPVVQAVALVLAILVVLVNLVTDLTCAEIDPRIRLDA